MNSLNGSILPMSTILPEDARAMLVRASSVESRHDAGESPERAAAVTAAEATIRAKYPQFFQ